LRFYNYECPFKAIVFICPTEMNQEEDDFADLKDYMCEEFDFQLAKSNKVILQNQDQILENCTANFQKMDARMSDNDEKMS